MPSILLRSGRERSLQQRHPWVFSGAIAAVRGNANNGQPIDVYAANGEWLARGFYSANSQIQVRLATWEAEQPLDEAWLRSRLTRALAGRAHLASQPNHACRLVFSEADGLPGLIVDRYGQYLSIQCLIPAMVERRDALIALLVEMLAPEGIYEHSDADICAREGLTPHEGLLWGRRPEGHVLVEPLTRAPEQGSPTVLRVDLAGGQKTGHYLDQAYNHERVAVYCQQAEVLDGFCYSGGFSVAAARAGASRMTLIDSSAAALELARTNVWANAPGVDVELVDGDMFHVLRQYREQAHRFDVVILDPPKFAHSQRHLERAARGYKDINLLAMQLLRPGGILATFSCSGLVAPDLFQKIVAGAARDARREVQLIERLTQSPDHPVLLTFPESEYLKGLICRVW
ncbi:class I SAM-dependent rRNA methyltransferase [Candidatus Chloroploca sp. M-50]|uniref:Class I SAM-dependent rRNA methyltransferase n=1 Tax=Candidatus Chloroploca mongolica TaxID=2528176 RepID=A0ABS4DDB0_9CHLR|nr:class I SAM-dependent rRNA methyltransferase [Candidatus Chloroploca mongolica]MBP1467425.1 class I SAM-dependent rRNA methyltransferase [Candidatus Chloroploca mongolica]